MDAQRVWPSTVTSAPSAGDGQVQQGVVADGGAQHRGVVAQLADLGRRLVDEAQVALGRDPHRAGGEQRVVGAAGEQRRRRPGRSRSRPWPCTSSIEAGGVPAADLEAVDGAAGRPGPRRRRRWRTATGSAPARSATAPGGAEPVPLDGPEGVLEADDRGVDRLERRRWVAGSSSSPPSRVGEGVADLGAVGVEHGGEARGRRGGPRCRACPAGGGRPPRPGRRRRRPRRRARPAGASSSERRGALEQADELSRAWARRGRSDGGRRR